MYLFSLAVYAACFLNIGFVIFILMYYVPVSREKVKESMRWHTIFVSFSYMMLEIASMIGCAFIHMVLLESWVLIASVIGTISLTFVFRSAIKKRVEKKFENKN